MRRDNQISLFKPSRTPLKAGWRSWLSPVFPTSFSREALNYWRFRNRLEGIGFVPSK